MRYISMNFHTLNVHLFIQSFIHSCSEKAETLITILLFVESNLTF